MNETGNQASIRAEAVPLPEINFNRPKIAKRRWDEWMAKGHREDLNTQGEFVGLAIREYAHNRGTQAAAKSLENLFAQLAKLEAML